MAVEFIYIDRETPSLLPASVQDYIAENHLARFITEIVSQLDLRAIVNEYSGRGSKPWPPSMMVALLFYGYATGVFSSRKLERASHDSLAFRYICANSHPDHDSIASFRRRFAKPLAAGTGRCRGNMPASSKNSSNGKFRTDAHERTGG